MWQKGGYTYCIETENIVYNMKVHQFIIFYDSSVNEDIDANIAYSVTITTDEYEGMQVDKIEQYTGSEYEWQLNKAQKYGKEIDFDMFDYIYENAMKMHHAYSIIKDRLSRI